MIGYYISLPFLYLVSLLPFRLLCVLSDAMFLVIYRWIGYRKKVIMANLKNSFPEKTEPELDTICEGFYRFFCDFVLETLKTLTISPVSLKKHIDFPDTSLFRKYKEEGRSVIVVMGHYGNWEFGGARFSLEPIHQLYVVYHPLANKHFEKLLYKMRTRLGTKLYAMRDTMRSMLADRDKITATAFIADQTPFPEGAYWTTFLNQETAVFNGPAKLAVKMNYPIIYVSIQRPKRGQYRIEAELLIENPSQYTHNEISEIHTRRLEKDIIAHPELWLWTHRRWKHKRV